jgi:hypothetical protein
VDITLFAVLLQLIISLVISIYTYCEFVCLVLDSYSLRKLCLYSLFCLAFGMFLLVIGIRLLYPFEYLLFFDLRKHKGSTNSDSPLFFTFFLNFLQLSLLFFSFTFPHISLFHFKPFFIYLFSFKS